MVTMSWTLFPSWEKLYRRPGLSHPSFRSVKAFPGPWNLSQDFIFWLNSRFTVLITLCLNLHSSSHVRMWELDHNEGWEPKNWYFQIVVLEKTLECPLDFKRSSQSILKEINPKYSLEGLMLKLKLWYVWPRDAKSWLIGKDLDSGKDWRQEEKGVTEDEMVGWHHQLNGHESLSKLQEMVKDREARRAAVHGVAKSRTCLSNWTTTTKW